MTKTERIVIWSVIGLLVVVNGVGGVMIAGELQAINAVLVGRTGGDTETGGTGAAADEDVSWWDNGESANPPPTIAGTTGPQVGIAGVTVSTGTIAMTVTVRSSGGDDLLVEAPVLVNEEGRSYHAVPDCLEEASFAFLKLVTTGQAQARLTFAGEPARGERLTLVFNSSYTPDDTISPRVEVPVPVISAPPTPTPEPAGEGE
jgi:hypothetical protein